MKALSVRQPWAWLLVEPYKNVENRTWSTKYRGELLIHASSWRKPHEIEACRQWVKNKTGIVVPPDDELHFGGFVGRLELWTVITAHHRLADNVWFEGPYGFMTRNARRIPFVAAKGALRLFEAGKMENGQSSIANRMTEADQGRDLPPADAGDAASRHSEVEPAASRAGIPPGRMANSRE